MEYSENSEASGINTKFSPEIKNPTSMKFYSFSPWINSNDKEEKQLISFSKFVRHAKNGIENYEGVRLKILNYVLKYKIYEV